MNKNEIKKSIAPYIVLFLIMMGILYFMNMAGNKVNVLTYDTFMSAVNNGKVTEVEIVPRTSAGVYEISGKMKDYADNETFFLRVPLSDQVVAKIMEADNSYNFKITTSADPESSYLAYFLVNVLPLAILVGVSFWFFTRQMASTNKSLDFGKSRAKLSED